jgi:hypothetical protein
MQTSLTQLDLGDFQSQNDPHFQSHWVGNNSFDQACNPAISVVFGAKGGGKSAFLLHMMNYLKENQKNVHVVSIDLGAFKYGTVTKQVNDLVRTTGDDGAEVLSRYWRCLLLLHFLREAAMMVERSSQEKHLLFERIMRALEPHSKHASADIWLLDTLRKTVKMLEGWLVEDRSKNLDVDILGLAPEEIERLDAMPEDPQLIDACISASGHLVEQKKAIWLVLDGIDSVSDRTDRSALNLVLNGLVRAAQRIAGDRTFCGTIVTKVLMPRELFVVIDSRQFDNFLGAQTELTWRPEELVKLLDRRLSAASERAKQEPIVELKDVLPSSRQTFKVLLRYSMYRPRHLLIYLKEILATTDGMESISIETVMRAVSKMSSKLTMALIAEYRIRFPNLKAYIQALAGLPSVVTLDQMLRKIAMSEDPVVKNATTYVILDQLYSCGAIAQIETLVPGLSDPSECSLQTERGSTSIMCSFSFKPGARDFWLPELPPNTEIAIHPMIGSYAGIQQRPEYLIG